MERLAVDAADAVDAAAHADRERRHAHGLVPVVGVDAAQPQHALHVRSDLLHRIRKHRGDLVRSVGFVAGRHRRMGGEYPPTPSSAYCASRIWRLPSYRREVTKRWRGVFSGTSVSSRNRPAVGGRHLGAGTAFRIGVIPVLVLPAGGVHALVEIALPVEQPDADHRQGAIRGFLEDVAGEHAQPPRVDGQATVQSELGAEEGDRALRRGGHVQPRRPRQILFQVVAQGFHARHEVQVHRRPVQRILRRLLQKAHRILPAQAPAMAVDIAEHLFAVRVPDPAEVVGHPRQRRQPRRNMAGQYLRRPPHVLGTALDAVLLRVHFPLPRVKNRPAVLLRDRCERS
ncbi:MAG: hypothetical protein H6R12_2320 [Proteobacteria bacterium]|nr:hypothetical protein [Pseudomonadota bacterium]